MNIHNSHYCSSLIKLLIIKTSDMECTGNGIHFKVAVCMLLSEHTVLTLIVTRCFFKHKRIRILFFICFLL
jgi:hypothetical protein